MKIIAIILAFVLVGGTIWFLVFGDTDQDQTNDVPSNDLTSESNQESESEFSEAGSDEVNFTDKTEVEIEIEDMAFAPQVIRIKEGTTVTWKNSDSAAHTVTSDQAGPLASENLSKGEEYGFTFNEAGTFDYICELHPSMTGTVIVESI